MAYQCLEADINDRFVGTITLNRPDHLNTFSSRLAEELFLALQALDDNSKVRVIRLKGAGKAFCAGIDITELGGKSTHEYRAWIEHMERPLVFVSKMKKPVIAQVHGVAAANGAGLVAAADLAIAADNCRIGLTAINVGLNCVGPVLPVARSVGRKKALELLFFGELIKAPQALEMGLVNRVVPKDDLDNEGLSWAENLASKSPVALQIAKQAFYASSDMTYTQQFDFMNEAFARLCSTHDAGEGVAAFFEKRPPKWQGR
jgi:enoyl-CoA hydratase/carnithine racemase